MLSGQRIIKLNLWLLIVGLVLLFLLPYGLLILTIAACLSIYLWKFQNLKLSINYNEFISIALYSVLFSVAGASGIKSLITAGLLLTAPFLSMGYILGSIVASIITSEVGYQAGLILAIYFQAHWLYLLYRATRGSKNV